MDENQIAQRLAQNIPQTSDTPVVPTTVVSDAAMVPVDYEIDEMTQYKLHQHFGEEYKDTDPKAKQQLSFIYSEIANRLGTTDYPVIVGKINDLKGMLGLNHTENSRYKLYQWMRLDQRRTSIEREMNNIRGAY